jgi:DNA-binding LacI/PurR family transcriptional regulator
MHDVARLAEVSHVTVSRVLNGYPSIRPETRERVLAAIAQLGYRRNLAARALVTSRSRAIGVLTPAVAQYGPSSSVLAIESAARDLGYHPLVTAAAFDRDATIASLEFLLDQSVEALVVIAPTARSSRPSAGSTSRFPSSRSSPRVSMSVSWSASTRPPARPSRRGT